MPLLHTIMSGRMKDIVKANNLMFNLLQNMNAAALSLDIAPRLQDNPLTSQYVALALSSMTNATTCAIICKGCAILEAGEHDPDGPKKAKAFIQESITAQSTEVPERFWGEMALLAAGAAPTPSPAKPRATKSDISSPGAALVKREPAESTTAGSDGGRLQASATSTCASTAATVKRELPEPPKRTALKRVKRA